MSSFGFVGVGGWVFACQKKTEAFTGFLMGVWFSSLRNITRFFSSICGSRDG